MGSLATDSVLLGLDEEVLDGWQVRCRAEHMNRIETYGNAWKGMERHGKIVTTFIAQKVASMLGVCKVSIAVPLSLLCCFS